MSGIDGIGRVQLDPHRYPSAGTRKRRDPDGDDRRERDGRRSRRDADTVTLGQTEEEPAEPDLPHGSGHAERAPAPHWDAVRRF
jgi:hypothetical protein